MSVRRWSHSTVTSILTLDDIVYIRIRGVRKICTQAYLTTYGSLIFPWIERELSCYRRSESQFDTQPWTTWLKRQELIIVSSSVWPSTKRRNYPCNPQRPFGPSELHPNYLACKVSCTVIIVQHCVPNLFPRFRHLPKYHVYLDSSPS